LDFGGPIVVIGLDSNVQERLARLKIGGVQLSEGLNPTRLRYDGLAVGSDGKARPLSDSHSGVLYLNTRVGWPSVHGIYNVGVAVVDRTSFGDSEILERSLEWSHRSRARSVVVICDVGDAETADVVQRTGRKFRTWIWTHGLLAEATQGAAK